MKLGRVVFEIHNQTDKQTNRQTNMLITILRIPTGSEVIIEICGFMRRLK